jgi:uncharacterized phiE125 gp8 family phage protein
MGLKLKTAPSVEPVTLAEAKLHCKVDAADDDALITALIVSARQQAEHATGRALVTQVWELSMDAFPADSLEIPRPILQTVDSITYLDTAGIRQTLANTEYQVIVDELIGRVVPAYDKTWPTCREQPGSVVVTFTAGYGLAVSVPSSIKAWMLLAVATLYGQREAVITGPSVAELPRDFSAGLLDPYRVVVF